MPLLVICTGILFSTAASVLPTIAYVLVVWRIDRYEKEPIKLLVAAFLWGALPAVFASALLETLTDEAVATIAGTGSQLVSASFVAPPVEEAIKALSLVALFFLARDEFDGVLDGIIYGSVIGFGFAATENLFFYVETWQEGNLVDWSLVVFGRAFAFGLNHAMFTSLTGVGLGLARYQASATKRGLFALAGFSAAIVAHFFHNFFLSAGQLCVASLAADWLGVLVVLLMAVLSWRRERMRLAAQLADEVAGGVLTGLQYETILSRRGRLKREWELLGISGTAQARLWHRLVVAATELAFAKHRQARSGSIEGKSGAIAELRDEILRIRQELGEGNPAGVPRG